MKYCAKKRAFSEETYVDIWTVSEMGNFDITKRQITWKKENLKTWEKQGNYTKV